MRGGGTPKSRGGGGGGANTIGHPQIGIIVRGSGAGGAGRVSNPHRDGEEPNEIVRLQDDPASEGARGIAEGAVGSLGAEALGGAGRRRHDCFPSCGSVSQEMQPARPTDAGRPD